MRSTSPALNFLNGTKITAILASGKSRKTQDLVATPIHSIGAEIDRDPNLLTLNPGHVAAIGLLIPGDWSGKMLNVELPDAATDLVLHKSPDLPVDLIG